MREGPLAQLFRKTEEDEARPEQKPRQGRSAPRPSPSSAGNFLEGGPAPQVTRHVPEAAGADGARASPRRARAISAGA